jgi:RNA polymerase sigma-70 factor (ECF subfamily)
MVLSVCRILLVDPAEAEDAMQQTFFYAYRSLLAGSEPHRPAAWLARIARNECVNRIRARAREPVAQPVSNGTHGTPDALNAAIDSENLRALERTIKGLPKQQREALLLHEFCGLPYGEVAAAIGVSEGAIGSLLFRARSRLRAALHRTYASIPIPAVWNALDHLLARGTATKIAALPVVAKLGTAAVAVGLTAGTAVVVEHDVQSHHQRPSSPPVHRAVSSVGAPTPAARVRRASVASYRLRVSRAAIPPTIAGTVGRSRSAAKMRHGVHPGRSAPTVHSPAPAAPPVSLPEPRAATPSHGRDTSSSTTTHRLSQHGPATHDKAKGNADHGRSLDKTPAKKSGKESSAPKTAGQPSPSASPNHNAANVPSNGTPNAQWALSAEPQQQPGSGGESNAADDHANGHAHQGH